MSLERRLLLKAADFCEDRKRWTRNASVRNKYGHHVCWGSEGAVRFCALMAVAQVSVQHGVEPFELWTFLERRNDAAHELVRVNDTEGRKAAVAFLRKLAAEA